jgi:hypothetical protein
MQITEEYFNLVNVFYLISDEVLGSPYFHAITPGYYIFMQPNWGIDSETLNHCPLPCIHNYHIAIISAELKILMCSMKSFYLKLSGVQKYYSLFLETIFFHCKLLSVKICGDVIAQDTHVLARMFAAARKV